MAGGINLFTYAYNQPINFIDPLGLDAADIMPGIRKAIVGGAKAIYDIALHGHPLAQTALGLAAVSVTAPLAGAAAITATPSLVSAAYMAAPYSGTIADFTMSMLPTGSYIPNIYGAAGLFTGFILESHKWFGDPLPSFKKIFFGSNCEKGKK